MLQKIVLLIMVVSFNFNAYSEDIVVCDGGASDSINMERIDDLSVSSEKIKVRDNLFNAEINHVTMLSSISVGGASIYLTTQEGMIVDLNIDVDLNLLGKDYKFNEKVTINELKEGKEVHFYVDEGGKPILTITPRPGFNERGGQAVLKILEKDGYAEEQLFISSANENFKAHNGTSRSGETVRKLDINVSGLTPATIHTSNYSINE